jgi:hypothetical protein
VDPAVVVHGRLGELIESIWRKRINGIDPIVTSILIEAMRLVRHATLFVRWLEFRGIDVVAFHDQIKRIAECENGIQDWLSEAPDYLQSQCQSDDPQSRFEAVHALRELNVDCSEWVMSIFAEVRPDERHLYLPLLHPSTDRAAEFVRKLALQALNLQSARAQEPLAVAAIRALQCFPSIESERVLVNAIDHAWPEIRHAAWDAVGWWTPCGTEFVQRIQKQSRSSDSATNDSALCALARLGNRKSLNVLRSRLRNSRAERVHQTLDMISSQGIALLLPDIDALSQSDDPEIALRAELTAASLHDEFMKSRQYS